MRKLLLYFLLITTPCLLHAQIGLKAGLNFANVTNASSINSSNRSGFMVGAYLAPPTKGIMASRTEIIFSRQGYNFQTSSKTGSVNLDYIIIPQLMGINITKFVQLQLGAQMAFLLNAEADSTSSSNSGIPGYPSNAALPGPYASMMSYYNKFDYGYAVGAEIHPFKGLVLGARYNVSLGKLYKDMQTGQKPSFTAEDAKNNVIQIFLGWTFGNQQSKKKGS
jgi:hypothetical protein